MFINIYTYLYMWIYRKRESCGRYHKYTLSIVYVNMVMICKLKIIKMYIRIISQANDCDTAIDSIYYVWAGERWRLTTITARRHVIQHSTRERQDDRMASWVEITKFTEICARDRSDAKPASQTRSASRPDRRPVSVRKVKAVFQLLFSFGLQ